MPGIFGTLETCRHRGCYPPSTEMEPGRRGEEIGTRGDREGRGPCQMGQIGTAPLPPREVAQPPCAHDTKAWHIRGCFRRTPVPDAFWNWHGGGGPFPTLDVGYVPGGTYATLPPVPLRPLGAIFPGCGTGWQGGQAESCHEETQNQEAVPRHRTASKRGQIWKSDQRQFRAKGKEGSCGYKRGGPGGKGDLPVPL